MAGSRGRARTFEQLSGTEDVTTAATTIEGIIVVGAAIAVFAGQEFRWGYETPDEGEVRDDRTALLYLTWLPVGLITVAFGLSVAGWGAWPAQWPVFVLGIVVLGLGVGGRWWSHRTLGRFHQAVVTIQADHQLITDGPYRWVRHPMYAASALGILGVGLAFGTGPGLILVVGGTMPAIIRRIQVEERALSEALGTAFEDYARSRARLVPGVW